MNLAQQAGQAGPEKSDPRLHCCTCAAAAPTPAQVATLDLNFGAARYAADTELIATLRGLSAERLLEDLRAQARGDTGEGEAEGAEPGGPGGGGGGGRGSAPTATGILGPPLTGGVGCLAAEEQSAGMQTREADGEAGALPGNSGAGSRRGPLRPGRRALERSADSGGEEAGRPAKQQRRGGTPTGRCVTQARPLISLALVLALT